jgi:phosphohistidine phosphatase SixA/CHAD domain-containing protein
MGRTVKKTLIVMRHGKAKPSAEGQRDMDRSLTKAGAMALEGRLPHMLGLLEAGDQSARIWASPATRAGQTAKLLEDALKKRPVRLDGPIETHDCLWEQDSASLLDELRTSEAELVFAVGHVPHVEDIVEALAGSAPAFSTGALGCLELCLDDANEPAASFPQDKARLLWFVQGPVVAHWDTLVQLQKTIARAAESIEDRRDAFFADPKDIETIHRFRTNSRTLRSLMAFVKPWQNAEQNAEIQTTIRDIVRHTSHLRELDVLEKQVRANPDWSPELVALCEEEADLEREKVLKALASKKLTRAFERAMDQAKSIRWKRRCIECGLPQSAVRARFDALVEPTRDSLASVRLSDVEATHDVRKRAKRIRYIAEFCERMLGADAVDIARDMMAHQDSMGDLCDARANIELIGKLLERDLPERVRWELKLMRAQNETSLYETLKADDPGEA